MIRYLVFSLLIAFLFLQCKSTVEKEAKTMVLSEDFEVFFEKFHQDSLFQIDHIQFPLDGERKASGSNIDLMVPVKWYKEDWIMHKAFNAHGGTFKRNFYKIGPVVVEKISDGNQYFSMERRFTKMQGEWQLIFYGVSN